MATKDKQVQTFGRKRAAVAVALCKEGRGHVRLNGQPLHLIEPAILRVKAMEPILLLGRDKFAGIDVRVRVQGGGHSSQVYAVRQAIAKAVIAYAQKCELGRAGCVCAAKRGAAQGRARGADTRASAGGVPGQRRAGVRVPSQCARGCTGRPWPSSASRHNQPRRARARSR